jgi:hypothetical protein
MCRSKDSQARPDGNAFAWCPRPPGTDPDYSMLVPECDVPLTGAGGPEVWPPDVSHLPTKTSPQTTLVLTRLTIELSGSSNREAIGLSA